jgi:hypothetical protein
VSLALVWSFGCGGAAASDSVPAIPENGVAAFRFPSTAELVRRSAPMSFQAAQPLSAAGLMGRGAQRAGSDPDLAAAMTGTARQSITQAGTEAATQALLDCQKGDYPGGGMGSLSLPSHRASARADHCFR